MTDAERQAALDAALTQPAAAAADGVSVQNRSLTELRDAADQAKATTAAAKSHRGVRFNKLVPPGANG